MTVKNNKNEHMKLQVKKSVAISDSGFVFNASTGDSYTLNPIGSEILGYIRAGKQAAEIKDLILEKYDVDLSTLEQYLYDFLFNLQQMQLIEDYE